jgi:formylglycine-generating enzyme required for sulfatase activity
MTPEKSFKFMGADFPTENIEWNQAMMFCRQASQKMEKKLSLPTEAQWEYACRAGTTTAFYTGEQITSKQANYDWDDSYNGSPKAEPIKRTMKVGSFAPNAFGLYDMHGNVWELCYDVHKGDYYKMSPEKDPVYDKDKGFRVVRGGGWDCNPEKLRSANRSQRPQDADRHNVGFRVVMTID